MSYGQPATRVVVRLFFLFFGHVWYGKKEGRGQALAGGAYLVRFVRMPEDKGRDFVLLQSFFFPTKRGCLYSRSLEVRL